MKKVLIIVMILLFILGMQQTVVKKIIHKNEEFEDTSTTQAVESSGVKTLSITAVGDCTFATDDNAPRDGSFVSVAQEHKDDYSYFFKNVKSYFDNDDLTIVNFEGTLSENGSRADKQFAFRGKPEYVQILTSSSVEAANLANNHTKDYGTTALEDTKNILEENGISYFGWNDIRIVEKNGIRIGLIGTNALNDEALSKYDKIFDTLKEQNPDIIIATFHWGNELDKLPTDQQKELAHKAIDNGADLVIGHHPHVLQGIEKYNGRYILYSLGNFCFGGNGNPSDKDTMIYKQTFTIDNGTIFDDDNYSVIPCSISSTSSANNYQPTPLTGDEYTRVAEKIQARTTPLSPDLTVKFSE